MKDFTVNVEVNVLDPQENVRFNERMVFAVNDGETKNGVLWAAMGEASGHFISAAVHDCCERGAGAADKKPKLRTVAKLKKKEA